MSLSSLYGQGVFRGLHPGWLRELGRELPVAAARDNVDCRLVVRVDGGNCLGPPSAVQQVCVLHHLGAILEVFSNKVVYHVGGGGGTRP